MTTKRTTELAELKKGADFTWGEVIRFHQIGEYDIVECYPWKVQGVEVLMGKANKDKIRFHGWLYGDDARHSWSTLDEALAGLIALKHEGPNSRAATYFIKMLSNNE